MKNMLRKRVVTAIVLALTASCASNRLDADGVVKARLGSLRRDDMVVVDVKGGGIDTNAVREVVAEYDRTVIQPREGGSGGSDVTSTNAVNDLIGGYDRTVLLPRWADVTSTNAVNDLIGGYDRTVLLPRWADVASTNAVKDLVGEYDRSVLGPRHQALVRRTADLAAADTVLAQRAESISSTLLGHIDTMADWVDYLQLYATNNYIAASNANARAWQLERWRSTVEAVMGPQTTVAYTNGAVVAFDVAGDLGRSSVTGAADVAFVRVGTSVTNIADGAFGGFSNVVGVTVPCSVVGIGASAFADCPRLASLSFNGRSIAAVRAMSGCPWGAAPGAITAWDGATREWVESRGYVTSVNGQTGKDGGAVALAASDIRYSPTSTVEQAISAKADRSEIPTKAEDIGALPDTYTPPAPPVASVNGKTGAVVLAASDVGALPDTYAPPAPPVASVNGKTGAVVLAASDVGALPDTYTPPPQVNADWTATNGAARILNKPDFAAVATSGSYDDLEGKPEFTTNNVELVDTIGALAQGKLSDAQVSAIDSAVGTRQTVVTYTGGTTAEFDIEGVLGEGSITNTENVETIKIGTTVTSLGEYALFSCDSLTSVTIPDGVTSIGDYAFSGCDSLTSVTIGNGVTSIGMEAFSLCGSLASVTIPDGVTSIGDYAFRDCSLTSVTIPDGVTSIGDYAFSGCDSLTSVTIGNGVTSIGDYAFSGCSGLTNVIFIGKTLEEVRGMAYYPWGITDTSRIKTWNAASKEWVETKIPMPVAPSADASAEGKPADAKATGDALAGKRSLLDHNVYAETPAGDIWTATEVGGGGESVVLRVLEDDAEVKNWSTASSVDPGMGELGALSLVYNRLVGTWALIVGGIGQSDEVIGSEEDQTELEFSVPLDGGQQRTWHLTYTSPYTASVPTGDRFVSTADLSYRIAAAELVVGLPDSAFPITYTDLAPTSQSCTITGADDVEIIESEYVFIAKYKQNPGYGGLYGFAFFGKTTGAFSGSDAPIVDLSFNGSATATLDFMRVLADRTVNLITVTNETSIVIELPSPVEEPTGVRRARDFFLDVDNANNANGLTLGFAGLGTGYALVVDDGADIAEMTAVAAGKRCRLRFRETAFVTGASVPVLHVSRVTCSPPITQVARPASAGLRAAGHTGTGALTGFQAPVSPAMGSPTASPALGK